MWSGWAALGGTELVNATRVEQYARHTNIRFLTNAYDNEDLPLLLGDGERYTTPLQDDAPWVDPDNPYSWEFLGAYPVDIAGIENSTRGAEVIEYITAGGVSGRLRDATKPVVFNVLLVATSEAGAEYGMTWLERATRGGPCQAPFGVDLCYFASEPRLSGQGDVQDLTDCAVPLLRTLRKFQVNTGPTVIVKHAVDHGALWQVQFAGTAGVPYQFGSPVEVITGFLTPHWDGIATDVDPNGYVAPADDCAEPLYAPLYDPRCPALLPPPGPPDVPLGCYERPASWRRRSFKIPADVVPLWSSMVPVLQLATGTQEVRTTRLRFYADPDLPGDPGLDPCGFCGDLIVSYIPPNSVLTFDAAAEVVAVTQPGGLTRRADTLVYGSDGKPFAWPDLSCGFGYVVTVDNPLNGPMPAVDLTLMPRVS